MFVLAAPLLAGCGAMFNGTSSTVKVMSNTPGAEVYLNGGLAGKAPASFTTSNQVAQAVTIDAPGHAAKTVALEPKVKALPIVMDVLWCATIIGVAAPISDALLGTFTALEPKEVRVDLERAADAKTPLVETPFAPGVGPQDPASYAPGEVDRNAAAYAP